MGDQDDRMSGCQDVRMSGFHVRDQGGEEGESQDAMMSGCQDVRNTGQAI